MGPRADKLAVRIEEMGAEIGAFTRECPDDRWPAVTEEERWPVCVVCRHIARAFAVQSAVIRQIANGAPPPTGYTWETIHESNGRQAREWAESTKGEVLRLLRESCTEAARIVRGLSDTQLDVSALLPILDHPIRVQAMIEGMIDHARVHLQSARTAHGTTTTRSL
jgi:hypothetical protein